MKSTMTQLIRSTALMAFTLATIPSASGSTLGASVGVYVYPVNGQSQAQMTQDDAMCFSWAKQQTGFDPVNPQPAVAQSVQPTSGGHRLRGAARGALGGAIIGEVANDDASHGAAIGATLGVLHGGAQQRREHAQHQQQADINAQQASEGQRDNFQQAYGACIGGKGYSVG